MHFCSDDSHSYHLQTAVHRLALTVGLLPVEEVTLDLSDSMRKIVRTAFPEASRVIDRFHIQKLAFEQQTRDRLISPVRGQILDRNNTPIATSKSVSAISVIHAQVKEPEKVAKILSEKLDLDYTETLEKINKRVALMRIKTKVDKANGKEIADLNLKGVVVDEDIQRIYPFNNLASHVIGFVGKDNQGIIGLEAKYEQYLKGEKGKILTQTDGRGHSS